MKYILDTNICTYLIKKHPESVLRRLKKVSIGDIAISTITLAELQYGITKSAKKEQNRIALMQFLTPFEILPFSENAAAAYGTMRGELEGTGNLVGSMDMLIASQAIALKMILVTNNEKELNRIRGLKLENWAS
ncbi:MAG: type II toxin-antitoxin system VapC family toxin [Spirochaetaceae bacterium]|nr:MAG: type II toxin-antitoxin system VapC family toxin [Spirochaetaceae bacterium]